MASLRLIALVGAFALLLPAANGHNIVNYGAVANDTSYNASYRNGKAVYDAFQAANSDPTDRTVLIPAGLTFAYLPYAKINGIQQVTMQLEGVLSAFEGNISLWPLDDTGRTLHIIELDASDHITFTGNGTIQGNGYRWWWYVFLTGLDNRPHMIVTRSCTNFLLENLHLVNSPQYHVFLNDMINVVVQGLTIRVDIDEQRYVYQSFGYLFNGLPIFPLNTDGIDIAGQNITVRYCHVENFDDSICIKPSNGRGNLTHCSENMHIHDNVISLGVGASVGSVPPDVHVNCIRNITFERLEFFTPIKTLYVKPNPCPDPKTDGTGIIDQITYRDIVAHTPLWWAIWVSTQQQHQPGKGADTGCSFFYPLPGQHCPTQPCVPVTNLVIKNFTATNALLSPGVLRCNGSNPCRNWLFEDVNIESISGWPFGNNFLCHALENFTIVRGNPSQCVYNSSSSVDVTITEYDRALSAVAHLHDAKLLRRQRYGE